MFKYGIIQENIKTRRTVRRYSEKKPDETCILELIDLARWSPSAHNSQPWRFVYIKDVEKKKHLIDCMTKDFIRDIEPDAANNANRMRKVSSLNDMFLTVPVLIVSCITMSEMDIYPDEKRQKCEEVMAAHSMGAATQTLLLGAKAKGLASGWFCAPLFCQDTVKKVLELPEDFKPQAFITLGYSEDVPEGPSRKDLDKILIIK